MATAKNAPGGSWLFSRGLMVPAVLYWLLALTSLPEILWKRDVWMWCMTPLLVMGLCVIASTAALMVAVRRLPLPLILVTWSPLAHVLVVLLTDAQ